MTFSLPSPSCLLKLPNATTSATAGTPGISGGTSSTSALLSIGDLGSSTSGKQVVAMIFHRSLGIVCEE